jgi:hypothetical protein
VHRRIKQTAFALVLPQGVKIRQADALMLNDHDECVEREACDVPF